MAKRFQTDIDALAAPVEDGGILVWPDPGELQRLAEENRRRRAAYRFEVLGRSVGALIAPPATGEPVMMTGHQPSFFHPGVWAKTVVAAAMAARLGGRAEFLVVDSDALHQFALQWPQVRSDHCLPRRASPYRAAGSRSYEQLPPLPARRWEALLAEATAAVVGMGETAMRAFAEGFMNPTDADEAAPTGYVTRWAAGVSAVARLLDIASPRFVRASGLFSCGSAAASSSGPAGDPDVPTSQGAALTLVAHLLLNAEAFAAAYNASLSDFRARRGIRGPHHPIPDLAVDDDRVELPLWFLRAREPRRRLFVSPVETDAIRLWSESEPVCTLGRQDLQNRAVDVLSSGLCGWEIRPRALILTMYTRLFACDLFIHGIGGAKYDQITDAIIRRFFGIEPPACACVSATLRLPLPTCGASEAKRASCRRRVRDVRHNPQRYLGSRPSPGHEARVAERLAAIKESDQLRHAEPGNRAARRTAFERIHRANAALLGATPGLLDNARRGLETIESELEHDRVALSREWFFALYPIEKLRALQAALPFSGPQVPSASSKIGWRP